MLQQLMCRGMQDLQENKYSQPRLIRRQNTQIFRQINEGDKLKGWLQNCHRLSGPASFNFVIFTHNYL